MWSKYCKRTSPGVRQDVQVASRAGYLRRQLAPNLRLAAGDHDEKHQRVYLLEAITRIIRDGSDNPSLAEFAHAITFSTGIYDQRTEAEVEADVDRICRLYKDLKHKEST